MGITELQPADSPAPGEPSEIDDQHDGAAATFLSESHFAREVFNAAPVIVLLLDPRGIIQRVNPHFEQLTGWRLDEIKGKEWFSTCLPARDQDRIRALFRTAIHGVPTRDNINPIVTRDGAEREIEWNDQVLRDADGRITSLLSVGIDVTERRRTEDELRKTRDRLNAMLQALPDLLFEVDQSGQILDYRANQTELLAASPGEFLGRTVAEVLPPDAAETCLKAIREADEKGIGRGEPYRLMLADGEHWFELSVARKSEADSNVHTFILLAREITLRVRSLQEVRKSEEHYRRLVENSPYCIHELDREGRFLSMNQAGLRMINEADESCIIGRHYLAFVSDAERPRIAELLQAARNGQHSQFEFTGGNGRAFRSSFVPHADGMIMGISLDITEQQRTETALRESEARYRRAELGTQDGLWEWNITTSEVYFSPRWQEMLGYRPGELPGHLSSFGNLIHPDDLARVREAAERHLQAGSRLDVEFRLRCKGGENLWVRSRGIAERDAQGNAIFMSGSISDISARKQAEAALQQERDRLRQIVDAQFGFVCVLTPDGVVVEANQTPLALMGLSRGDVLGRRFWEVGWLEPGSEPRAQAAISAAARGETVRGDAAARFPGLGRRAVDAVFSPLRDPAGRVINVIGFGVDITEHKQAEEALRSSEARLKEAQRIAGIGSWELDFSTSTLVWSDEIFRIFENDPTRFGASYEAFLDAIHPEDREMVNAVFVSSVEAHRPYDIVHRLLMADGRIKFVRERCETAYDAAGQPIRSAGTIQDITDRKLAEMRRQEIDDRLRLVLENISDGFFILDRDWRYVEINLAGAAMVGRTPQQLIGRRYLDEFPEMSGTVWEKTYARVMQFGEAATVEEFYEPLNKWFEARVYPFAAGVTVFFADITARKQAELETQQLRDTLARANRLGTLSELASGLAHELNQPLGVINVDASTALLLSERVDCSDLRDCLRRIRDQAFRAGEIVRRMRSFIRRDTSQRAPHNINLLVREVLMLLDNQLRHSAVTIELSLAERLPPVVVDGIQIQQVLVNLVRNADDAMAQNVETPRVLSIRTETAASEIRVSVTDTGCGLDPAIAAKLFFPFQTTKVTGLGLGLVTCRTIVEAHGGQIEARPIPCRGTTFTFTLPVTP